MIALPTFNLVFEACCLLHNLCIEWNEGDYVPTEEEEWEVRDCIAVYTNPDVLEDNRRDIINAGPGRGWRSPAQYLRLRLYNVFIRPHVE